MRATPLVAGMALMCLPSCAARLAHQARAGVLGMSRVDMLTCAGVPAKTAEVGDTLIATYTYESHGTGLTTSLPLVGTVNLSDGGQCTAVWRLTGDRVVALHYTGADAGFAGPEAACAPLVRDCLHMAHAPATPPRRVLNVSDGRDQPRRARGRAG